MGEEYPSSINPPPSTVTPESSPAVPEPEGTGIFGTNIHTPLDLDVRITLPPCLASPLAALQCFICAILAPPMLNPGIPSVILPCPSKTCPVGDGGSGIGPPQYQTPSPVGLPPLTNLPNISPILIGSDGLPIIPSDQFNPILIPWGPDLPDVTLTPEGGDDDDDNKGITEINCAGKCNTLRF